MMMDDLISWTRPRCPKSLRKIKYIHVIVEVTLCRCSPFAAVSLSPVGGSFVQKRKKGHENMSQSLHAIKRFRLRELLITSPKTRIPPAATASASNQPQRPLASTPLAAALPPITTTTTRSGTDIFATAAAAAAVVLNNPFVPHKNPKSGRWAPPKYSLRRQADLIKHARKSGTLHLLPLGPKMSETQLAAAAAAAAAVGSSAAEEQAVTGASELLLGVRRGQGQGAEGQDPKDAAAADGINDAWTRSVEWVGTVRERGVAGADIGNRLYAGKKRMFKGHKWERGRERRVARTKMLLRDMDKRVQRFKAVRFSTNALSLSSPASFFFFFGLCFADGVFPCFLYCFSTVPRASRCRWQEGPMC